MSDTGVRPVIDRHVSHNEAIANYLESGRSITAMQALRKFGCARLAARICDLRDKGYDIKTMPVIERRNGVTKRYAKYVLE